MRKLTDGFKSLLFVSVTAVSLSGCFEGDMVTEKGRSKGDQAPVVEATIEYPGPSTKWAGPSAFRIHVIARGKENAKVMVSPPLAKPPKDKHQKLKISVAREDLELLATAMETNAAPVAGCLSPVVVRLIGEDGLLVEREACRGQAGWPRVASKLVFDWLKYAEDPSEMKAVVEKGEDDVVVLKKEEKHEVKEEVKEERKESKEEHKEESKGEESE